jgi:hypothetical protein
MSIESVRSNHSDAPSTEKSFEATLGGGEPKPLKPGDQIILRTATGEHIGTVIVGENPQNLSVSLYQDLGEPKINGTDTERGLQFQYGPGVGASVLLVSNPKCDGPMLDLAMRQYLQAMKTHQPEVLKDGRLDWVIIDSHGQPGAQSNDHYDYILGAAPDRPVDNSVTATIPPQLIGKVPMEWLLQEQRDSDKPDTVFNPGAFAENVQLTGCQLLANQSEKKEDSTAYFDALQAYCDEMNVNVIANSTPSAMTWGDNFSGINDAEGNPCPSTLLNQGPGGDPFRFSPHKNPQKVAIDGTVCPSGLQSEWETRLPYDHIYGYVIDKQNLDPNKGLPTYDMTNQPMVKPQYNMFDGEILMPHHTAYRPYMPAEKTTVTMQGDVEK